MNCLSAPAGFRNPAPTLSGIWATKSLQKSIGHLATHAAQRWGTRQAVGFAGERRLSFADIDALAGRFAGGLDAIGVRKGDRVVLNLSNGWRWIVAYHALARMGAVVVPANIVLSQDELSFVVINSGATAVIVEADPGPTIKKGARAIVAQGALSDGSASFDDLLLADVRAPIDLEPATLFTIGYTSGTTGKPKGAMLSHGNIFSSVAHTATIHVRHENDRVLSALPLAHVYGNVVMNACFMTGAVLHGQARFNADDTLRTISDERITLFEGVPTMYYQMLGSPALAGAELSSLTRCTVGGQSMPASKIEAVVRRFGCPILELWGMTELGGPAVSHSPYWPAVHQSIGLPFPGTEIRIADLEHPERDAQDNVGELMIRGDLVTSGYWDDAASTASAFVDGWFATGDIARRGENGYLYIVDRKKEMILTSGYNVYPAEVEQAIAAFPGVAMVAVSGYPDELKGEVPRAFVVRQAGADIAEADLVAHCRRVLAAYKAPRAIFFVDDLPRTGTGKIMRRALNGLPGLRSD